MAETFSNTFEAITLVYTPKVLADNIIVGSPTLEYFKKNMLRVPVKGYEPLIEYATLSGTWYGRGEPLPLSLSGDIATRAHFDLKYYALPVFLAAQDVDGQGEWALVDMMKAYIRNAINSASQQLNEDIWNATPSDSDEMAGLSLACDDASTWGGLSPSTYTSWKAHVMEGEGSYATPVSPTVENLGLMISRIQGTVKKKPDIVVVAEDYWDVLAAQISDSIVYSATLHQNNPVVRMGFDAFFVKGVPVTTDRKCPGEDWVSGKSTRAAAKGYQAFFLNFDHIKLLVGSKRSFQWDPAGWRRPEEYDGYFNRFYAWLGIGGDRRAALGRIFNVHIAQNPNDYKAGTVSVPY